MFDSRKLLGLLCSMPQQLNVTHLKQIQEVIDADKANNNFFNENCSQYAPFCSQCNKNLIYPCAVAYIERMSSQEKFDVTIAVPQEDLIKKTGEQAVIYEQTADDSDDPVDEQEQVPETIGDIAENSGHKLELSSHITQEQISTERKIIRIAIAKRK